jgi:SAM-dependent methyltransferase
MKLNFGCGRAIKKGDGWVNADIQKAPDIEYSFDFESFPYPFEADTFDLVLADNVIEHLRDCERVVAELHRICKNNAEIIVRVPYWNAKCAYNDVTHKAFFNEVAMEQLFGLNSTYRRTSGPAFECVSMTLVPSNMCRIIPGPIRYVLSVYLCNVIRAIEARFRVIK